jgi:hypothetical protein
MLSISGQLDNHWRGQIGRNCRHPKFDMNISDPFVHDGRVRYFALIYPEIEAAVRAEFADRLAQTSWLKRLYLRLLIRREICRRIDATVSAKALY